MVPRQPRAPHPSRRLITVSMLAFMVSACSDTDQGGGAGYVTGEGVVEQISVADRVPLPTLHGATLDGRSFDSSDYVGTMLVVNVWGSWCPPCRKEAPGLRRVSEETRDQGVQFVGIDVRDNDAAAIAFEGRYKITYPSLTTAGSGAALLALGSILPRNAIPSTVVVDRNGKVAARVIGGTTYRTLRDLVDDVLAEPDRK